MEQACQTYQEALRAEPLVHEYLTLRGITGDSAQFFRLGFVAEPLTGHEDVRGRLAIPYVTPTGVVGFKFRAMPGLSATDTPKYRGLPGAAPRLYNAGTLAYAAGTVAIVEGELDAIVTQQETGIPAVGIPGVDTWKAYMARCFAGLDVYLIPDHDPVNPRSGERPGEKLVKTLTEAISGLVVVRLPEEKDDPTTFVLREGGEALCERLGIGI
ncbi:hypothetical protein [Parafrankia sp. EUN1f]|uniref:hypothetical protein n=1 Tax=Parafrankia sp. EUN1f TaxID=102897 RepID=UPI0001C459A7|nr:hypothetical protein [Parafrankia sp. EUN1f]EFC86494.1 DNA primase-like protein [Parafrankia sp. EUN1f]